MEIEGNNKARSTGSMRESLGGGRSAFRGESSGSSQSVAQSSASVPPSGSIQQGAKQPDRGDLSPGGKGKQVKLTPRPKLKTRKQVVIDDQLGSEYVPSQDLSSNSRPAPAVPAPHTAQAPQPVPSELFDGSAAGGGEYSTSPIASVSGESAEGGTNSDNEVPDSGVPQSEEPVAVESSIEPSTEPSTMPVATTVDDLPPGPSSSIGPSTLAGSGVPSSRTHPFTAHQLSRTLAIEAHSAPSTAQIPQSIEDTLKKLLDN
uniref:Splicing factor, proline- and glutamine-rich-like n=1 Tax=Nicotiana tabacum TaxID=4097 RepID=A0A1S4C328_TOBAC|nr:PREDICTED: splicing factor, proline- and glutamine-rich-like [Nicotiana tabacum]